VSCRRDEGLVEESGTILLLSIYNSPSPRSTLPLRTNPPSLFLSDTYYSTHSPFSPPLTQHLATSLGGCERVYEIW
jgi:hypothetical protein